MPTIGLYTAAAGMQAQQKMLDNLSNDLANVDTNGYRPGRVQFADLLYQRENGLTTGSGVGLNELGRSDVAGEMAGSQNPLAAAIDGTGYFQVKLMDGTTALTRVGDFKIDVEGNLVTISGNPVDPPVKLPVGTDPEKVLISPDGTISIDGGPGVARIQLFEVPSPSALNPIGGGLLQTTVTSGPTTPAATPSLVQGQIESSAVDFTAVMADLVEAQRAYGMQSRMIKTQDQLAQIANDIRR